MGKRGLCLALEESRKKRKPPKPKDHYQILKICRSANAQQIRQAYRQRALETHPDRLVLRLGRQPSAVEEAEAVAVYQQIVEAFELLADSDARRIYDAELGGGNHGSGWEEERGGDQKAGQHEAEAQLLLHGYLFQWQEISLAQPSQTLIALRNLLCGAAGDAQEDSRGTTKENLDPCMFARPQGYEVQMSWSTLTVATTATKSLAQALSWRASLTAMRHEAQRRLHRTAEGKAPRVPLLDSELKALLVMQPDIRLMFRYQVPAKKIEGERIPCRLTLFTPRLELASQMRDEMSAVTSKRKLDEVVASYKNTVAWEKKKAKQYFDKVLQEINKTVASRLLSAEDQLQKSSARGVPGSEVSQRFCATLGLESSAQIKSAIANLQQVPIPERSRRVKALLAKAKALPAPPAVLPVAPPPTARRSSARGRTWTGGLLPRETMATIVSGLPFFDLAQCRPASKGMLSVSHDCYWQRCRNMSLPLDPTVLGGFRRNRAGRIYYKTDALTVTLRFVAQPKVISTVERLNLENMTGKDVGERLFGCLNQIKHLQFVLLPATGWNDSKSLQKIRRLLSQRGIGHAIAKIR